MLRALTLLLLASLLAACGGDGVRPRLFPPSASIQELAVQPDGSWQLKLRVQNFSNVAMTIARVQAELKVGNAPAGTLELTPGIAVPPESAEVFETRLMPQSAAAQRLLAVTRGRGGQIDYALSGRIDSSQPDTRRDEFEFASRLSTVPGLERVLR